MSPAIIALMISIAVAINYVKISPLNNISWMLFCLLITTVKVAQNSNMFPLWIAITVLYIILNVFSIFRTKNSYSL